MMKIWRWEWIHEQRGRIASLLVEMAIIGLVGVFYMLKKQLFFRGMEIIKSFPACFLALLGLDFGVGTGNILFYLTYAMMLVNARNMWKACERMVCGIDRDEDSGSVCMMCNQWFDREQLVRGKWSWNVIALALQQVLLYLWTVFFALIGSVNRDQRITAVNQLAAGWLKSFMVILFFLTLSCFYASHHRRRADWHAYNFRECIFWIPFITANLHKLKDVLFFVLDLLNRPVSAGVAEKLGWMERLYWISPLSWMNPFYDDAVALSVLQEVLCLALCLIAAVLGTSEYRKREFLP